MDKVAYVFCVLEEFHRNLRRREIYALTSQRWADPRARLLAGPSWRSAKGPALNALGLAEDPSSALARYTRTLDAAWRHLAGGLIAHPDTVLGADGRLHAAKVTAVPDPPSLTDLRTQCQAMLPRVDPPELILEVMSWCPGSVDAFTAASGGQPRMADHT